MTQHQTMHSLIGWAQRHGLRAVTPISASQSLVCRACWHGRFVVVKLRYASHTRRLEKESTWLTRAHAWGLPGPLIIARISDETATGIILSAHGRRQPWRPSDWAQALAPLHRHTPHTAGWGPLRADDRPRWQSERKALDWYQQKLGLLDSPSAWQDALVNSWPARQVGLIHGDCHRDNQRGGRILDWENVALADPWEDAARGILADNRAAAWQQALAIDNGSERWRGAWLRSVIESASFAGPRQAAAMRMVKKNVLTANDA